ncbi:hypothetical protein ACLOJK_031234 [Asimina triloba]
MSIATDTFEMLSPSRFISFTFPNPYPLLPNPYADSLRVAVLDSALHSSHPDPQIAALLVPKRREHDWLFSTHQGHLQLLANSPDPISRLILVGDPPQPHFPSVYARPKPGEDDDFTSLARFQQHLLPLLRALSPKSAFHSGIPKIPFVSYEDDLLRSVLVSRCHGDVVGEMLVEDVEIEVGDGGGTEFRRRLRFKRMPNLIQTVTRIVPVGKPDAVGFGVGDGEFRPETSVLVQPYLIPMVAGLSLAAVWLEELVRAGRRPRMLCLGVGGGSLMTFLRTQLGFFDLLGVEMDESVLELARQYFGLVEDEHTHVCVGDGMELIQRFARQAIHRSLTARELAHRHGVDFGVETVENEVKLKCFPGAEGLDFCSTKVENGENGQCVCSDAGDSMEQNSDWNTSSNITIDNICIGKEIRNADFGRPCRPGYAENPEGNGDLRIPDACSEETGADDGIYLSDVIMVDLDSGDARTGLSAPPSEFIEKPVILASRLALHEHGILVMNVIIVDESFYAHLIRSFREVFSELYEIDVGNGENYVLIGTASPINSTHSGCTILERLKQIRDVEKYIDCIQKI